jgi:formylglycine-generating enzyme required for sulfatase activity
MKDHNNNLTDSHIRDLLRRRLLEQEGDEDELTQKLTDMEAKLAFGTEALYVPSAQKEKELLNKLRNKNSSFLKWLLPVIVILSILFIYMAKESKLVKAPDQVRTMVSPGSGLPAQRTDVVVLSDSAFSETRIVHLKKMSTDTLQKDTLKAEKPEKWKAEDAGIKVEYKPKKHNPKFVDPFENIPVLTEKEIALTKKFKERMVRQLLKKDKNVWGYVPMSTDNINGETVSLNAFYIATSEVTNNQYRTFLNDLLIQGKMEEFLKAVPDTSKWISDGRALWYKLQPDSTKWPSGVAVFFEPMRKNYYWHPAYDSYPVLNVSREGAKMYCDWLTNAANEWIKKYTTEKKWESFFINDLRIPQDVEWIMAAKGGQGNVDYPWKNKTKVPQNEKGCYLANFCIRDYKEEIACPNKKFKDAYNSAGTVSRDYIFVAPVMSYNPNEYGLYCLAGNVAEMVWISKTGKPGTKGGSWNSDAEHIKIDAEDEFAGITQGSFNIGFRPVFTAKK